MPSLVLRLLVLLVVLLSVTGWRTEERSVVSTVASPPLALGELGAVDVGSDHVTDELSPADDGCTGDVFVSAAFNRTSGPPSCGWAPWVDGLEPGGPPLDAPLKPPRV